MSQRKKWSAFLFVPLLIVTVSACTTVPPQGESFAPSVPPAFPTENPYLEIPRVRLEEAKAAFDGKAAIFVDVRSTAAYQESHVAGALSIPGNELENRTTELNPNEWIITYCT
jgi:hypothetical protein